MLRTISIKLKISPEDHQKLLQVQQVSSSACNSLATIAQKYRCWNRKALHDLSYYQIRQQLVIGSQMVCNGIRSVCDSLAALQIKKNDPVPLIEFRRTGSVHYDKRTYSIKDNKIISLYTLEGRITVGMDMGDFQRKYMEEWRPKEAELICKRGTWFFNLVIEQPDVLPLTLLRGVLGVDLGENNLAATSSGKIFGGGELRHHRDSYLALRKRLQSNGSKSSKQRLKKISGKEAGHVKHINHCISSAIMPGHFSPACRAAVWI